MTFSRQELEGKSRDDLKVILKNLNGSIRGFKAELIDRILEVNLFYLFAQSKSVKLIKKHFYEFLMKYL